MDLNLTHYVDAAKICPFVKRQKSFQHEKLFIVDYFNEFICKVFANNKLKNIAILMLNQENFEPAKVDSKLKTVVKLF